MKIHGTKYQTGAVVNVTRHQEEEVECIYCQIQDIYVHMDHKVFRGVELKVLDYSKKLRAVKINFTNKTIICTNDDFKTNHIFHIKHHKENAYIIDCAPWFLL